MRTLPKTIVLPTGETIEAGELQSSLAVSRAVIHLWRKRHGFPRSMRVGRNFTVRTQELAVWLNENGAAIKWI